jgi:hypothetical protein
MTEMEIGLYAALRLAHLQLVEKTNGYHNKGCNSSNCDIVRHMKLYEVEQLVEQQLRLPDPVAELGRLLEQSGAKLQVGLRQQGHIPTVERMLAEGKSWDDIGRAIGWHGPTVKKWYEMDQRHQAGPQGPPPRVLPMLDGWYVHSGHCPTAQQVNACVVEECAHYGCAYFDAAGKRQ